MYFFNEDSLVTSKYNNKFVQIAPTILTGLGPLFTFLNIAIAFTHVDFSNQDTTIASVANLMGSMQIAALCSVLAVSASLIFMFFEKLYYNKMCRVPMQKVQELLYGLFDNISSEDKINLFNKLRDKNISTIFYDDLRRIKDYAYDKIKEDMIDLSKYNDKINKEYSAKYGFNVYDLRDCEYTMLVRTLGSRYKEETINTRDCYSIISNENSNVYGDGSIVYGYYSFDNDNIIHMLEQDSFSSNSYDNENVTKYVNRIMTSKEIVNGSSWYSEVDIANKKDDNGKYKTMKPDFIIAYDFVSDLNVIESKRLGIPIVLIKKSLLKDSDRIYTGFNDDVDIYNSFDGYRNKIVR